MRPPRILLVDDTSHIRALLSRVLTGQGYLVLEAGDGPNAVATCQGVNGDIDLLLTDIKMPGMDGIELARSLTAMYPSLPVLFISGQCEEDELQAQVTQKGFQFLSKPFMPQALIQMVEQLLSQTKRPVQTSVPSAPPASNKQRA